MKLDSPICQWEALLLISLCELNDLSLYCHAYRVLFCEMGGKKNLSPLQYWTPTSHNTQCMLTARPQALASKMNALSLKRNRWVEVEKKSSMSFSVNDPCSSTPSTHPLTYNPSLLQQVPLRGSCCICMPVNMFESTFVTGHPESDLQKDFMAAKMSPMVCYKVTDDWPAASQTLWPQKRGPLLYVALSVHSSQWSERCFLAQPSIDGIEGNSSPLLRQTDCLTGKRRSVGEGH